MSKKAKLSVAELLPSFEEAQALTNEVQSKKEKKRAKRLTKLTKALGEAVDCHAILLATNIIESAKNGEIEVTHRLREDFEFKNTKPTKEEKKFALDCMDYVAEQLRSAMEPGYNAQAYAACQVDSRGLQDDFDAYPVQATIVATLQAAVHPGGSE